MRNKVNLALFFFIALPVFLSTSASAASSRMTAPEAVDETHKTDSPYVIGPQNLLQVKIFGEAGTNQIYRVDEDGFIKHALAGRMMVGGLTVSQAENELEKRLQGDYIINPQVTIFVMEYSHFSIIGEVRRPGSYEITGRISIIRAISMAGGFTPIANQRGVQIIRKTIDGTENKINIDATRLMSGDMTSDELLEAEDVVVVPKSFF